MCEGSSPLAILQKVHFSGPTLAEFRIRPGCPIKPKRATSSAF
jgi:hypothetical protein